MSAVRDVFSTKRKKMAKKTNIKCAFCDDHYVGRLLYWNNSCAVCKKPLCAWCAEEENNSEDGIICPKCSKICKWKIYPDKSIDIVRKKSGRRVKWNEVKG